MTMPVHGAQESPAPVEQKQAGLSPFSDIEKRGWMARMSDPNQWDIWHKSASTGMSDTADRVDHFFGDERLDDENRYTRLRLGTGLGWHKNDGASLLTDIRLRLSLPQLKNRFQIVVDDTFESDEPDKGSAISEAVKDSEPDAALRYIIKHDERRRLTSDVGVRLSSPSQVFGRLRGSIILPFPIWELRLSQSAAWFTDDGVTETSELRWSRPLWTDWLFRAISRVTWEENNNGVTPAQSFSLFRELTTHRGYRLGASGYWPETPHAHEAKYTTEFTYRQLLHSRWLFLEISPGLEFPQKRDYECTPYISVKLEIIFDEERGKKHDTKG
ncbi:MAG: hypothetical protein WA081_13835 [Desulfosalsimonadaceae bacterium]